MKMDPFKDLSCDCHQPNVLILGEGNFSFARSYVTNSLKNSHIFTTSYDSKAKVDNDIQTFENVSFLRKADKVTVRHSIDATKLKEHFCDKLFCKIIFNFPHVGGKSNIKACRKLLYEFFVSASDNLCNHGDVVVSLCQGQSGTPVDIPRRLYKNSWMVATQANDAGMVLSECIPFEKLDIQYSHAGYRGQLKRSFRSVGGLVNIFKRGIPFSEISNYCSLQTENIFFSKFFDVLKTLFAEKFNKLFLTCIQNDISSQTAEIKESKHNQTIDCCFSEFTIDYQRKITPYSNHQQHQVTFIKWIPDELDQQQLMADIVKNFQECIHDIKFDLITCLCRSPYKSDCLCLNGDLPICHFVLKNSLMQHGDSLQDDVVKYNLSMNTDVPHFISDITEDFWRIQAPDICISAKHENGKDIIYKDGNFEDYKLNALEEEYFQVSDHNKYIKDVNDDVTNMTTMKLVVDGICIANISIDESKVIFTVHSNEMMFVCYEVPDIRYLWSNDDLFHENIINVLERNKQLSVVNNKESLWKFQILYPLCYRHDLSLWLDKDHHEKDLFHAIRTICSNLIYAVRLIKVLRHEETSCVSYCYRMFYSSVDRPLTQKDTVEKQNELRLYLINKGFQLR